MPPTADPAPVPDPAPTGPDPRPRRLARPARLGLISLAVLVGVLMPGSYLGIVLYTAHVLTSPRPRPPQVDPRVMGAQVVPWSTRTEDGVTLRGWYVPTTGRRLIVLVHGLWESWESVAGPARDLRRRGYDVLVFDLRGHGRSDPARLSMGRRERRDVRAVLAWAREAGYAPDRIGWVGYSLGGSTLLMEAERNPALTAVAVDSPFGDLPAVLDHQLAIHSGLPRPFNPGILLAADWAFGARSSDLIPIRSARRWGRRPLLVIHGTADDLVPVAQARALAAAAGPDCQAVILPGLGHTDAYRADPRGYVDRLDRFFAAHLAP